jgi:sec-independent protein translocase protein TatA
VFEVPRTYTLAMFVLSLSKTNQHLHESVSCSSFCLKNAASLVRESRRGRAAQRRQLQETRALPERAGHCTRPSAASALQMGLFGLGWPEIAVIAGVGLLIWGPSRIGELGRNLGTLAGNLKRASSEFKEGLETSLADAEKEEKQKEEMKLKSLKSADPTAATTDSKRS